MDDQAGPNLCVDCGKRTALHPALVDINSVIQRLCQKCWNMWAPYMHRNDCECPHCEGCKALLRT